MSDDIWLISPPARPPAPDARGVDSGRCRAFSQCLGRLGWLAVRKQQFAEQLIERLDRPRRPILEFRLIGRHYSLANPRYAGRSIPRVILDHAIEGSRHDRRLLQLLGRHVVMPISRHPLRCRTRRRRACRLCSCLQLRQRLARLDRVGTGCDPAREILRREIADGCDAAAVDRGAGVGTRGSSGLYQPDGTHMSQSDAVVLVGPASTS